MVQISKIHKKFNFQNFWKIWTTQVDYILIKPYIKFESHTLNGFGEDDKWNCGLRRRRRRRTPHHTNSPRPIGRWAKKKKNSNSSKNICTLTFYHRFGMENMSRNFLAPLALAIKCYYFVLGYIDVNILALYTKLYIFHILIENWEWYLAGVTGPFLDL